MKRVVICLVFVGLFVGLANAQTNSVTGTVVDYTVGNSGKWTGIDLKVGNKKYFVYTESVNLPTPKIVGKVDEAGRTVQVFYTRIVKGQPGYDGELRATKIVEIKTNSTNQNVASRGTEKSQDGAWETFWRTFSSAVQRRDRRTLKGMMTTSFQFASEEMGPDQAFTFLDAQKGKAWIALNGVVAKGAVVYKSPSSSRPSRIAPPIAGKNPNYDSWRAIFELGRDGRWRWVAFVIGD